MFVWKLKHYAKSKPVWLAGDSQVTGQAKRIVFSGVKKYTSTQKVVLNRIAQ